MEISSNTQTKATGLLGKKDTEETTDKSNTTFQNMLKENDEEIDTKEVVEVKRTLEELVADIVSLLQTGMTVDERERLQELLLELKEKIKEGNYSEKEIETMLSNIEKEIQALQKRISGQVIKDAQDNDSNKNEAVHSNEKDSFSFLERIEKSIQTLSELTNGEEKKKIIGTSANESELLEMIKEFQK